MLATPTNVNMRDGATVGRGNMGEDNREQGAKKRTRGNRPIDRVRDGAGKLTVGTELDGAVTDIIGLSDAAFVVKERAIYRLTMADEIDPDRQNINIPNSVQPTLPAGSDSDLVARTMLTAHELFPTTYFAQDVRQRIVLVTVDLTKNLLSAQEIAETLRSRIGELDQPVEVNKGAATLPSAGSLEQAVNAFVQATHSGIQMLYDLPRIFIKFPPKGWPDNFTEALQQQFGDEHKFTHFARSTAPFIKFLRNARHCIEHRRGDQRIDVRDFHLTKDGRLNRPTVAIVHSMTPQNTTDLVEFMTEILDRLIEASEAMLAYIADAFRPESFAGLPLAVLEVPADQHRYGSRVRLAYFTMINDDWVRLG